MGHSAYAVCCLPFQIRWCASHPPAFANTGSGEVNCLLLFVLRNKCSYEDFFWTGICGRELSLGCCSRKSLVGAGSSGFPSVQRLIGLPHCVGLQGVIRPVLKHGPRSPYTCASMWAKTHMRSESDCGDLSTHDRPRSTERGLSVSTSVGTRKMVNYV